MNAEENVADPVALRAFNVDVMTHFRANGGKVSGDLGGHDLLILHTTGASSGEPRTSPLVYVMIDGRLFVVGAYGGAARDPAWVRNLRANPRARVEVGTEAYGVVADEVSPEERAALSPRVIEAVPVFGEYQAKTDRQFPLFELIRTVDREGEGMHD